MKLLLRKPQPSIGVLELLFLEAFIIIILLFVDETFTFTPYLAAHNRSFKNLLLLKKIKESRGGQNPNYLD